MDNQIVLYVAGILIAALTAVTTGFFARKKTDAESADLITQAAERIVLALQASNQELKAEVEDLRREVARLHRLIIQMGGNPYDGHPYTD